MFDTKILIQSLKIILPIIFVVSIFCYIKFLKQELNSQINKNLVLKEQLYFQNKTIEKMKLETKNFKLTLPNIDKNIKLKYNNISVIDNTCNDKLQSIKALLDKFYDTNNKQYTK